MMASSTFPGRHTPVPCNVQWFWELDLTSIRHSAHVFFQCSQAGFFFFFLMTFVFCLFFVWIMVPKAEGSILSTKSHSLWEERMSVSGMLTSTKIWDQVFPWTFLAQHPKKYNLATVWLLWGTAYCSWKSIIPTLSGNSSVPFTLWTLPKWCLSILGHTTSACILSVLGKEKGTD